ncbi:hypothetical protein L7F22_018859 [Adiantum nelumboides]|nr:hypothetical protein [Adiantum nelumboides]
MADLSQVAPFVEVCAVRPDFKRAPAKIPSFADLLSSTRLPKHDEFEQPLSIFGYGDGLPVNTVLNLNTEKNPTQQSLCGAGSHGKLISTGKQEFGTQLVMNRDSSGVENVVESAWVEGAKMPDTLSDDNDGAASVHALTDVDACSGELSNLTVNLREEKKCEEGQGQTETKDPQVISEQSEGARKEEQITVTPPCKQAGWKVPEEPEFAMEDSSWPTLAEARHAKSIRARPSQARALQPQSSASNKEVTSNFLPTERVPSSQANLQDRPVESLKNSNVNNSVPGSKYKSSYKKGGFGKPSYSAMENLPLPPMGVHVPSANMFISDHTVKGNGLVGINKYFPGPHQAPARGPFYYPRADCLAPFQQNTSVQPTYGRGYPGWQHYGRGYGDVNYKHTTFVPPYDQQPLGPRHTCPPVTPFMNMNVVQYNYPSYQGDMSAVPGAPSPGFNYAAPYLRPPGPPGVMVQAPLEVPLLQETLQKQIEYYFSPENLIYDTFLVSKMDDEGFVPLSLIASFPRVRNLTWNTMFILDTLKNSTVVEVKNGKLRSHEWRRWKPDVTGMSGTQGSPLGFVNHTSSGNVRNHAMGELKEAHQDHLENKRSLSASRVVAGSCAAPWTGMPANVGAVSVPTVTSIDSR